MFSSSVRSVQAKDNSNPTVLCPGQYTSEVCLLCFVFCFCFVLFLRKNDKQEHKQELDQETVV